MKPLLIPLLLLVVALTIGLLFRKDPYRLRSVGMPYDQAALAHRDSPYTHATWVVSPLSNYMQLRFFDAVEGGICLHPSWPEIQELAANDPRLAHLVPEATWSYDPQPERTWPADWPHPNPGTLSHTRYTSLFPAGVLLNESLIERAGGDPRSAAPNILIVGLGSGVGISVLAHHFPQASIAVVDIDRTVNDLVLTHYPFFRWLRTQTTDDGRPRLSVHRADARQFVIFDRLRQDDGRRYDLVILDAYTDGSTIPSHLMTQEYYQEIRRIMHEDGIILNNIIGSYGERQRMVVGGAIRSKIAAGLTEVFNFPVLSAHDRPPLNTRSARNNVVVASARPLGPDSAGAAWQRLADFEPYPELPVERYISTSVMQARSTPEGRLAPTSAQTSIADPELDERLWHHARGLHEEQMREQREQLRRDRLRPFADRQDDDITVLIEDFGPSAVTAVLDAVSQRPVSIPGWQRRPAMLVYQRVDWVRFARRTWQRSLRVAQTRDLNGYIHDGQHIITHSIPDAPLFTDAKPNADIHNR